MDDELEQQLRTEIRSLQDILVQATRLHTESRVRQPDVASSPQHDREEHYRVIVSALSEGVVVQNARGEILACNPAAEKVLGLTLDQMTGRTSLDPCWQAVHADGSPFPGEQHPAMVTLRTGKPLCGVMMGVCTPCHERRWLSINTQPLVAHPGAVPYAVVSTFADITAVVSAQDSLRQSQQRLEMALQAARAGAWEWDISTNTIWWSNNLASIFGLQEGGFDGRFDTYLSYIHPDDRQHVEVTIQRALDVPVFGEKYEIEHRIVTPSGQVRWLFGSGRVFRNVEGAPTRMMGAVVDVSERRELETRLAQSQRMETVGRLAGGIAHDFNNLLTAVLGEVGLAQLHPVPQHFADTFENIRLASEQGRRLTRQLLSFASRQVLQLEPIRLGNIVAQSRQLLQRLLGTAIEVDIETSDTGFVLADSAQIEQVLLNLAINARDAMPHGGRLRVTVADRSLDAHAAALLPPCTPGPYVYMRVEDSGTGIAPDVLSHVLEPFFTTKTQGSGLGLSTCYGIVHQLRGHFGIESCLGRGTCVEVLLPTTASRRLPQNIQHGDSPEPQFEAGTETILVVEDEPAIRRVLVQVLRGAGYHVLEAEDGQRALALARSLAKQIDLVLTDVVMPGMSGLELAAHLDAECSGIKILIVSGYTQQMADPPAHGQRQWPFLSKPYSLSLLASTVRKLLDG